MYSSLPFALAQCMVEIPYNFVQVRAAQGTLSLCLWGYGLTGGLCTPCGVSCSWS